MKAHPIKSWWILLVLVIARIGVSADPVVLNDSDPAAAKEATEDARWMAIARECAQAVIAEFPLAADKESAFTLRMNAIDDQWEAAGDERWNDPRKALTIAVMVSRELNIKPVSQLVQERQARRRTAAQEKYAANQSIPLQAGQVRLTQRAENHVVPTREAEGTISYPKSFDRGRFTQDRQTGEIRITEPDGRVLRLESDRGIIIE